MTTAEQLADEIYGLHCDIGRLEQENARLRELMYDRAHKHAIQHMTEDELRITAANTLDENHKLRELVQAFDWCTENFDTPNKCDRCPLLQSDVLEPECEVRMRELRVER